MLPPPEGLDALAALRRRVQGAKAEVAGIKGEKRFLKVSRRLSRMVSPGGRREGCLAKYGWELRCVCLAGGALRHAVGVDAPERGTQVV